MSMPHIELASLGFARGQRAILDAISLSIGIGERVAILGPSGTGKSTLLQIVAGLLSPSRGQVRIAGSLVKGPRPSVTMMLQRPALLPWASALENVSLGLRFQQGQRRSATQIERTARGLLAAVGLDGRAGARPSELSGGEQQRVALARSLAPAPSVLLLDEPFSALDPATRAALRQDVAALAEARGITLLLVTHDAADAAVLCRRTVSLAGAPARIVGDALSVGAWSTAKSRLAAAA